MSAGTTALAKPRATDHIRKDTISWERFKQKVNGAPEKFNDHKGRRMKFTIELGRNGLPG